MFVIVLGSFNLRGGGGYVDNNKSRNNNNLLSVVSSFDIDNQYGDDDILNSIMSDMLSGEEGGGGGDDDNSRLKECHWEEDAECTSCTIVVAPSTIHGGGLGVFTLVELKSDETVMKEGDMVIPIPKLPFFKNDPFNHYSWSGNLYRGIISSFAPGLQSLANSHTGLLNMHLNESATKVFNNQVDSSPYHHLISRILQDVPRVVAGSELFTKRETFKDVPLIEDYQDAEALVMNFHDKIVSYQQARQQQNQQRGRISYNDYLYQQYDESWQIEAWDIVEETISLWEGRPGLDQVLPRYHDLQTTRQLGIRSLYESQTIRSVPELMDGSSRCLDGIRPGISKIHGMGAIASRSFSNGTVITGSPLIHTQFHHWNMNNHFWNSTAKSYQCTNHTVFISGEKLRKDDRYALIVNYCFAHNQSTIMLCPYGSGISYLNHSPKPNVALRWAPHGQILQNDKYFNMTPAELAQLKSPGLAIDYVAIRDIEENEELTIDYGRNWERANRNFQKDSKNFKPSSVEAYNSIDLLLTEEEQLNSPYPYDISLMCHPNVLKGTLPMTSDTDVWNDVRLNTIMECHVMERKTKVRSGVTNILYAVRVLYKGNWIGRNGIPRMYLRWFTSFTSSSFRYPMQLPDYMLPDAWKDIDSLPP